MLLGLFPSQGPGVFDEEFRGFQTGQTTTSVRPRLTAALIYQWEILLPAQRKDQRSTSKGNQIKFIRSKKYTDVFVFSVHFMRKPLVDGTDVKLRLEIFYQFSLADRSKIDMKNTYLFISCFDFIYINNNT